MNKIFFLGIAVLIFLTSCASSKKESVFYISPYSSSAALTPVGQSALVYGLPQTRLFFEVEIVRTMVKSGPYAEYANRMLGLVNVPTRDSESWRIESIRISERQELDGKHLYAVSFTDYPQNVDKLLRFTKEGLLMDLNIGNVLVGSRSDGNRTDDFHLANMLVRNISVEKIDTLYQTINVDTAFIHIPVQQRRVISRTTEELARDAAEQIFELRKWRTDILRGDADYPSDGEAFLLLIQTFNRMEEQLLSLFAGAKIENRQTVTYSALPEKMATNTELFHFSDRAGIVSRNTSGAKAVWYETGKVTVPPSVSPSLQAKNIVYYRIPQTVEITAGIERNILVSELVSVCQFGNIVSFPLEPMPAKK